MIKFHQKYFIETSPFEEVNPDKIRNNNIKFINLETSTSKPHPQKHHPHLHIKLTRQKIRPHYFRSTNRHPSLRIISR